MQPPKKIALITGGGRGIGEACARALGALGMGIALSGRNQENLDRVAASLCAEGVAARAFVCDVTHSEAVAALVETVATTFGPIDVLVNNAGIGASAPLHRTSDALWDRVLATNLSGAFYCMRAVLPGMVARGWGRVINIASVAGKIGVPFGSAYCASKHGLLGLTRALAVEVADKGITVNAICPGWVDTDMAQEAAASAAEATGRSLEKTRGQLVRANPQGRMLEASEVSALVAYLVTDSARGIHGQSLSIDGGMLPC